MFLFFRCSITAFVSPPTRYSPPVHMWVTMKLLIASQYRSKNSSQALLERLSCSGSWRKAEMTSSPEGLRSAPGISGCFFAMNWYMMGMAGPQKDLSRQTDEIWRVQRINWMYSAIWSLMQGQSTWPPSEGSTQILSLFLKGAEKIMELPRPVPGPSTPLVWSFRMLSPLREMKLSSSMMSSPQELAVKSFRKTKSLIPS